MQTTTHTTARRGTLRARLTQAAFAAAALVGTVSVMEIAGSRAGEELTNGRIEARPAAQVLTRQPSAALPTAKFIAEATTPSAAARLWLRPANAPAGGSSTSPATTGRKLGA